MEIFVEGLGWIPGEMANEDGIQTQGTLARIAKDDSKRLKH